MNKPLTPNELEILIHCHTTPTAHPRHDAPAVQEALAWFMEDGIIKPTDTCRVFTTTNKGRAWLSDILATPMPRQAWINSSGKVIEEI
jgi:hypothetical protein